RCAIHPPYYRTITTNGISYLFTGPKARPVCLNRRNGEGSCDLERNGFMKHLTTYGYALGLATAVAMPFASAAHATVIGPGTGITTNTLDSGGTRTNIDLSYASTLAAGRYTSTSFSFEAEAVGDVQPFLAILSSGTAGSSNAVYQLIAVGSDNNIASSAGYGLHTVAFGPADTFTVPIGGEQVFAGFTGTTGNNPVPLDNGTGADAHNPPAFPNSDFVVGGTLPSFSYPNLPREYAFAITVAAPEPTPLALIGCVTAGLLLLRRKRKAI
ncbi:MAG: PEP-CTERM sorting domain-containing protein, partial [Phycisphaerae bacterium]